MSSFRLRRRLGVALASLMALVFLSGGVAVATALSSQHALDRARRFEVAARQAAAIGQLAREQYIHEAHTILLRDRTHLDHHDDWVARFRRDGAAFRELLPANERPRLDEVLEQSHQLAEVFAHEIVPGIERHDQEAVRRAHREADRLVERMTAHADALALALERQAVVAEQSAARLAAAVPALAGALCLLAALLAFVVARWLWTSFATPLGALLGVAGAVTSGDQRARVKPLHAEEMHDLGRAFNAMLDTLAQKESELLAAERLATVGRIAAGVAHELNNPIGVIRGYLKTMQREHTAPALLGELRILDEEAAICQRISEDLLAYTRAPLLSLVTMDAGDLGRRAVERFAVSDPEPCPIEISVEPCPLTVDPSRLQQVLANLFRNARQATGGQGPIELRGQREGDRYVFTVADRGHGLPAEAHERIFEPFYTTRSGGSGLGLAVSYSLVSAHRGALRAVDREGGGTEMRIELPLAQERS